MAVVSSVTHPGGWGVAAGPARGDLARLAGFRRGLYRCFTRWPDTLFEICDALLCASGPMASLPYLTLEPQLRRGHGSVYKALARGQVDQPALADLVAGHAEDGWPAWFAVDASTWPRPKARCSPGRTFCYDAGKDDATGRVPPVTAGWSFQWVCQLSARADSWTAPMDVAWLDAAADHNEVAAAQVRGLVRRLAAARGAAGEPPRVPLFAFDAGYSPVRLSLALRDEPVQVLVRIRGDRSFTFPPPPRPPGTPGRHRKYGPVFRCADPSTWPPPDTELTTVETGRGHVRVQAWHHLNPHTRHRALLPGEDTLRGAVARVQTRACTASNPACDATADQPCGCGHAGDFDTHTHTHPDTGPLWLWWHGPADTFNPDTCWRAYLRRFDIEHFLRFIKQHLAWTRPATRTPHQAETWTWTTAAAYTQLRLTRSHTADHRLPWEPRQHPDHLTPARVKRGFRQARRDLGTPTSKRKPHQPGPGRPPGRPNRHKTPPHPVIKKQHWTTRYAT